MILYLSIYSARLVDYLSLYKDYLSFLKGHLRKFSTFHSIFYLFLLSEILFVELLHYHWVLDVPRLLVKLSEADVQVIMHIYHDLSLNSHHFC